MFREQIATVSTWFDRWTPCEQTVAMVALLRRLHPTQARFLTTVLHRQLGDCAELRRTEILANDSNYVASLANTESKEALIRDLLSYLPLLNPKNQDVKSIYLALIPKVLKYTLDHCALLEEARQLLSYSLIHPAFSVEDRGLFSTWLHQFEEKLNSASNNLMINDGLTSHYPSSLSGSPPGIHDYGPSWQPNNSPPNGPPPTNNPNSLSGSPASQSGLSVGTYTTNSQRIRRSNSLTPPVLHSDAWNSQEELCSAAKPRSLSLSSEISPHGSGSLASSGSGSESHLDDPRPTFTSPGMKDVPCWLKSLRLHKYSFLFAHLTFEEMMSLNEELLEKQGVTKGARHKIVLSIAKLKDRPAQLKQLYDDMTSEKEVIRQTLTEVKWILSTPMKINWNEEESTTNNSDRNSGNTPATNAPPGPIGSNRFQQGDESSGENQQQKPRDQEDDLPSGIAKVIRKACELNIEPEFDGQIIQILDKCLSHEAFSPRQKRLLSLWRQQQAPMGRRGSNGHHPHFHNHHHRQATSSTSPSSNNGSATSKHSRNFNAKVLNLANTLAAGGLSSNANAWTTGNSIHAAFMAKRPSLQDSILESHRSHLSVQRTKSAPLPNFFAPLSVSPPMYDSAHPLNQQAPDIFAGLTFGTDNSPLIGSLSGNTGSGGCGTNIPVSGSNTTGQQNSAMDITSRLESLCLSMTEGVLGPSFSNF